MEAIQTEVFPRARLFRGDSAVEWLVLLNCDSWALWVKMGLVFEVKMGTEGSNDRKPTVTLGKLCCKCFLRAKMGADVVWWKTQMVDFGQWVSYVEYGHNAKHTFFWGGGEPNLDVLIPISWDTSFFPITVTAGYWNSKRNTDQSTLFIYMHVLYMFVYSMDWFEDVWGNNVLLVKKIEGPGAG